VVGHPVVGDAGERVEMVFDRCGRV